MRVEWMVYLFVALFAGTIKATWIMSRSRERHPNSPTVPTYEALLIFLTAVLWPLFFVWGGIKQFTADWDE